jgi:MFS family permease
MSLLDRLVEGVVPMRLGRSFRWLLGSTVVNNAADGIALAAGPLLVASQTRDPFLVSLALLTEMLPSLLFGIPGGAIADRLDRKRIVIAVNLVRAVVLVLLVATIVTKAVTIGLVLVALFLLGTAEVFADAASSTLLPNVVERDDLGIANARMQGGFLFANQLAGPPLGAFLFAAGVALPFLVNALGFAFAAILVSRIALTDRRLPAGSESDRDEPAETTSPAPVTAPEAGFFAQMVEGVRWLLAHPPMRTLALTVLTFNVTFGATWGVLVLYAGARLGLGEVGFGVLISATAIGGVIGLAAHGWLSRRLSFGNLMRIGLLIETGTHLSLALTTVPAVAFATLVLFGVHEFVWGTTESTVRQRAVPDEVLGRVGGVSRVAVFGGLVVGAPLGGALAGRFGLTAPMWFGFAGSAVLVVLLWREFPKISLAAG